MTTLILSSRQTDDNQAMWRAAIDRDWDVVRARGIRVPPIDDDEIVIYVESLYASTIAESLGLRLLEPPEDWLANLPHALTRREIRLTTLGAVRSIVSPTFVKPPNDKSFAARVYATGAELPVEYDNETPVLIADPVAWDVEFRCFALDGEVRTLSPYLRGGELSKPDGFQASDDERNAARSFAEHVLGIQSDGLPRAIVLDVGRIVGAGWAVVEANAAWGSGIYGCEPDAALDVVRRAVVSG